jgi:type I restriction enzyme S subunit
LTINAFKLGGGFKPQSEKPFAGNIPTQYLLSDGDVLLAMTEQDFGLLASPLVINMAETKFGVLTYSLDVAKVEIVNEGLLPEFFFNVLRIPAFRIRASYGDAGSTVQRLPYNVLLDQMVPCPDLLTQQAIIRLTKLLDDKIRLNGQLAKTLEDIAQTIFKSWFIDFDPVKAKMAGEKPFGMDAATAALFPDSMADSELGLIPEGWEVEEFGSVNNLLMGQSPPGSTYNTEGVGLPFYQGKTDFGSRFPKHRVHCTAGNQTAKVGEILVSVRAPVGDLNQAIEECVIGRGVASALHKSGSQAYSFSLLTSLKPKLGFYNGQGTVFGAINRSDFQSMKLVEPSPEVLTVFDQTTKPLNDQIRNLFLETGSLIHLRDSLLPRLLSGELQIPEEMLVS